MTSGKSQNHTKTKPASPKHQLHPLKIHMDPKNHQLEKENDLPNIPNLHDFGFHVNGTQGVTNPS